MLSSFATKGKSGFAGPVSSRGITEDRLARWVAIVGAAKVVEELVAGARMIAFAYGPPAHNQSISNSQKRRASASERAA